MKFPGMPNKTGLYDPRFEHDACGIGFVAQINGTPSHDIIETGLGVLINMTHRGATGSDPLTGDGAGIMIQMPDAFMRQECRELGIDLPPFGDYGVGTIFLPKDTLLRESCCRLVENTIAEEGQMFLGWRDVPVSVDARIGYTSKASEPAIRQVIVGVRNRPGNADELWLERKLFIIRRRIEKQVLGYGPEEVKAFHICSLSSRTMLYKGMFLADQLGDYFPDLREPAMVSAFAMVHHRYSTNTFPTWHLAHPFRMICHNGEINTLRGNINWMRAREASLSSDLFGSDINKLFPIVPEGISDSASFDRAVEFLTISGRSLPHAMMMMIPEAWENHKQMDADRRAFYEFNASIMEPWDGPAAVAFADGRYIGATLDRNGLRPARYIVTKGGQCIMASEAGTVFVPPEEELYSWRLQPGRMFVIDLKRGCIIDDHEIKSEIIGAKPYRQWVENGLQRLENLPAGGTEATESEPLHLRQLALGYTEEDLSVLMAPMGLNGEEPIGSMGNDAALAVLSDRPVALFAYFKQLFAQVTNPPIDPIREELVMSLNMQLGPVGNLLDETPEHMNRIALAQPILTNADLEKIRAVRTKGLLAATFSTLFSKAQGAIGMRRALSDLFNQISQALAQGVNLIILSDRGINAEMLSIPILLATSAVHHNLIRAGDRNKASIIVESAEVREVNHFSLLVGYGANAINPYMAFETLADLCEKKLFFGDLPAKTVQYNYVKAINKGMLKVFSKMGISTLFSYCGAQIYEAIGLDHYVVERYFTGTVSRIQGITLDQIAEEAIRRHQRAYGEEVRFIPPLDIGGEYKYRMGGERHLWNPETLTRLQRATRNNDYRIFKEFTRLIDQQAEALCTLRGLFTLKKAHAPVPLSQVEPASEIVKRFVTGAMSYGSISKEAHETLAVAMNRIGGQSNTGEGGEDPERFNPRPNGDMARSAIKQVASGRFGVSSHYLVNSNEMQIKIAQGAKPGEGGQLPGHKVNETVAKVRNTTPGVTLISPPPHHDIYSIEDLAQLIFDLKNVHPEARVSVKLVAEVGVGTVAAGVSKAHADMVLISGGDGGTGASPLSSIKHAGIPWELGLAESQQTLVLNDLRGRIRLQVDGQLRTGRDVAIAALLGAEEFGFSTAPLVVEGCIMMRKCHLGTCPVGIATQELELRKKFTGKPEYLVNYFFFVANELREIMATMGFRRVDDMIGRVDRIQPERAINHWKARGLDFSAILRKPDVPSNIAIRKVMDQDHGIDKVLDLKLVDLAYRAFETGQPLEIRLPIHNTDRTVGAMLGGEISKRFGADGLPDNTINIQFSGVAGQSFGAFNVKGVSLSLEGAANDYVGKGMSGGRISIRFHPASQLIPEENIIAGNTILYGATGGEAYFSGVVGERFAVRNSGAVAVVEGLGDHGCEYMTGGVVVVLGKTGRNFAAGMSGGVAYVLDRDGRFRSRCNTSMVALDTLDPGDEQVLREVIEKHQRYTSSRLAQRILEDWQQKRLQFIKVMPHEYRRVLEKMKAKEAVGHG
ncbi:MAG: glutamate synthase large subunit [Magnetococcales bacterium]|nr:glutamate synthase large subunit [Magnetococcales bacterium]